MGPAALQKLEQDTWLLLVTWFCSRINVFFFFFSLSD